MLNVNGANAKEFIANMDKIDMGNDQTKEKNKEKNLIGQGKQPPSIVKKPSVKKTIKALEEEFMKAFNLINNDCVYIEPKLIPIIPGDDPAVINRTEFCDDN